MKWFAVHTITYFKFSDGMSGKVPVWENVVLVKAADRREAARVAESASGDGTGDLGGDARLGGRPGEVVLAGIRKVENAFIDDSGPASGDEITYAELTLPDMASVEALANGEAVKVECDRVLDAREW